MRLHGGGGKHISTRKRHTELAAQIACERYDDMCWRAKNNLVPDSRSVNHVCQRDLDELQAEIDYGIGKASYECYTYAVEWYIVASAPVKMDH